MKKYLLLPIISAAFCTFAAFGQEQPEAPRFNDLGPTLPDAPAHRRQRRTPGGTCPPKFRRKSAVLVLPTRRSTAAFPRQLFDRWSIIPGRSSCCAAQRQGPKRFSTRLPMLDRRPMRTSWHIGTALLTRRLLRRNRPPRAGPRSAALPGRGSGRKRIGCGSASATTNGFARVGGRVREVHIEPDGRITIGETSRRPIRRRR